MEKLDLVNISVLTNLICKISAPNLTKNEHNFLEVRLKLILKSKSVYSSSKNSKLKNNQGDYLNHILKIL